MGEQLDASFAELERYNFAAVVPVVPLRLGGAALAHPDPC
jgi:hypothetical protein